MIRALVVALAAFGLGGAAQANPQLAKEKNCYACHGVEKRTIAPYPAYKEVALKYAGDKGAVARLARKIREGGVGVWGQIPMPANPQVSEAEAQTLARWVLSLK